VLNKSKKKEIYFYRKNESFSKQSKQKFSNYMINVEEVQNIKKIKILNHKPHSKGIILFKFNLFSSNFLTTGTDNFINIKNKEAEIL